MPTEETLLDSPITPAPLFAYRALKGWFIGSPDSSPERDDEREREDKLEDKENILPTKIKLNLKSRDVDGYGHRSEDIRNEEVPRMSPQKHKRDNNRVDLLSPTKSILRTPGGALTPRARGLRDVNVTFKSVSPEVRRKAKRGEKAVVEEGKVNVKQEGTGVSGEGVVEERKQKVKTAQRSSGSERTEREAQSATVSGTDLQDHFRRTEKEMKRLIRYGQKWRDFARRQDEENTSLRVSLEEAQRENRRLEMALSRREKGVEMEVESSTTERKEARPQVRESVAVATGMRKAAAVVYAAKKSAPVADIEDLLDLTPPGASLTTPTRRATSAPNPTSHAKALLTQTVQPRTTSTSTSKPQHPTKASTHPDDPPQPSLPQRPASASITTYSPLTALQHRIEGSLLPSVSTAARTSLPEDRIAAVRKRLMAKRDARRAGGIAAVSVLEGVGGQRVQREPVKGKTKEEESGVDWVGI